MEQEMDLVVSNDTGARTFKKDTGEIIKWRKLSCITEDYDVIEFSVPRNLIDELPLINQGTPIKAVLLPKTFSCKELKVI